MARSPDRPSTQDPRPAALPRLPAAQLDPHRSKNASMTSAHRLRPTSINKSLVQSLKTRGGREDVLTVLLPSSIPFVPTRLRCTSSRSPFSRLPPSPSKPTPLAYPRSRRRPFRGETGRGRCIDSGKPTRGISSVDSRTGPQRDSQFVPRLLSSPHLSSPMARTLACLLFCSAWS